MKNTPEALNDSFEISWLRKVKVAFAAFAFVAAGVFGVSVTADVAPEANDTAQDYSFEQYVPREDFSYWKWTPPVKETPAPAEEPAPALEPVKIKDRFDPWGGGYQYSRSGSWS